MTISLKIFRHGAGVRGMILAAIFVLLTPGAVFSSDASRENTLVIGIGRDFFDGPDSRTYVHGSTNTWESLTYLGEGLKAVPWLAESWESSDDGRIWRFRLRKGVRFHNGDPLSASLAVESIKRIAFRPQYDPSGVFRSIEEIAAIGDLTIEFRLKEPSPLFPNMVAYYSSPVIHPSCFDPSGHLTGLTATGPYRLTEARDGDRIILDAYEGYWGKKPLYQRVIFRTLADARTRVMALMAGEIDAVADVGGILPQQAEEIKNLPEITLKRVDVATTHYILFNCRKPPFESPEARRWFSGLLDRKEIVDVLASGAGIAAYDPFSPLASQWTFKNIKPSEGKKPKVTNDPIVILLHGGTLERWPYRDIAQIVQAKLRESGFNSRISVREPGAYYEDIHEGRFNLCLQPNTLMTGEPDFFYAYYVASNGLRYCGCGTPEMDQLIGEGRAMINFSEQRGIYLRLSEIFTMQMPLLPLYHDISYYAHGPRVGDFTMDWNFRPLLQEAKPKGMP